MSGWAIRVKGRGLVTTFDDAPLETYEEAELVAAAIREALGEECEVERVLLRVSLDEDSA